MDPSAVFSNAVDVLTLLNVRPFRICESWRLGPGLCWNWLRVGSPCTVDTLQGKLLTVQGYGDPHPHELQKPGSVVGTQAVTAALRGMKALCIMGDSAEMCIRFALICGY